MNNEIDPKDVNRLIKEGKLEIGKTKLQFSDDGVRWVSPQVLMGIALDREHVFIGSSNFWWKKARFPMPELRDGDPIIVMFEPSNAYRRHYASLNADGSINCYRSGLTKWSEDGKTTSLWKYWRLPTPDELEAGGYPRYYYESRMK